MEVLEIDIRDAASKKFLESMERYPTVEELEELVPLIIELHGILLEEEIAVKDKKVVIIKKMTRKYQ